MSPNAARKMSQHETIRPSAQGEGKRRAGPQREGVGESHVREIAPRLSYRPPAPCGPNSSPKTSSETSPSGSAKSSLGPIGGSAPSIAPVSTLKNTSTIPAKRHPSEVPRAAISMAAFAASAAPTATIGVSRLPTARDLTPRSVPLANRIPAPPPLPREAIIAMPTTELALHEIDYDKAYAYNPKALDARLRTRGSVIPEALVSVAEDVRTSLAPAGREEAARELRAMRKTTFTGLALVLRRAATLLDQHA